MMDVNPLWFIMGIPAVIGFLLETKYRDVVRPLALLLTIPTIIWLFFLASMVFNAQNKPIDLNEMISQIFNDNFETLILSYVGGAIGTACAKAILK